MKDAGVIHLFIVIFLDCHLTVINGRWRNLAIAKSTFYWLKAAQPPDAPL